MGMNPSVLADSQRWGVNEYNAGTIGSSAPQLIRAGISVHPGQQVAYVIEYHKAKAKAKRVRAYVGHKGRRYDIEELAVTRIP
jgi:hypothetical protein